MCWFWTHGAELGKWAHLSHDSGVLWDTLHSNLAPNEWSAVLQLCDKLYALSQNRRHSLIKHNRMYLHWDDMDKAGIFYISIWIKLLPSNYILGKGKALCRSNRDIPCICRDSCNSMAVFLWESTPFLCISRIWMWNKRLLYPWYPEGAFVIGAVELMITCKGFSFFLFKTFSV